MLSALCLVLSASSLVLSASSLVLSALCLVLSALCFVVATPFWVVAVVPPASLRGVFAASPHNAPYRRTRRKCKGVVVLCGGRRSVGAIPSCFEAPTERRPPARS